MGWTGERRKLRGGRSGRAEVRHARVCGCMKRRIAVRRWLKSRRACRARKTRRRRGCRRLKSGMGSWIYGGRSEGWLRRLLGFRFENGRLPSGLRYLALSSGLATPVPHGFHHHRCTFRLEESVVILRPAIEHSSVGVDKFNAGSVCRLSDNGLFRGPNPDGLYVHT